MYICIDFDGTMVDHQYPEIGTPVPEAVKWCKRFVENGANIILWTMRCDKELDEAAEYFKSNRIKLFGVNTNPTQFKWTSSPKAYGHLYIDDAAMGCPLQKIHGFHRVCVDWGVVGPRVMEQLLRKS